MATWHQILPLSHRLCRTRRLRSPDHSALRNCGALSSSSLLKFDSTRSLLPAKDQAETLNALNNIKTTPFEHSFLSRLQGSRVVPRDTNIIHIDWETETPWMRLMADLRDHYALLHDDGETPFTPETISPLTYTTLSRSHLEQVHDILERVFWSGIDVTDSLDYSPEQATVIAMYKRLVVGVAILSSPKETYITFLAVRAGWDKAQITKTMLYLLVSRNPNRDITLHVSANNSAMLLYNQFGFKAEEFVAGFYEDYLDPLSRASKNAFKLRLRQ
ncbi:hypothetical protein BKA70DRAFT_483452 [Coprinopsis sp. MPI-PUGE-AT-0042]|nr:hypothetical protein BKA70DRAFT_483452 [Coprinopsis sp. MPI-PUGE-AT-0042]